ncbi:uncharacterized protein N7458_011923 [Penicillium daleae]|uniref:Uncharacterized protein n=1 Tax=Penicillium daleae TaxID=63821 RepID=A0AAD6FX97_9EURO|nr:uncharacterized protein N7458_011923 [Penicillium daleae]KAJ5432767.1 hypothetical protein N7458_011923 [Penicillium daleae]
MVPLLLSNYIHSSLSIDQATYANPPRKPRFTRHGRVPASFVLVVHHDLMPSPQTDSAFHLALEIPDLVHYVLYGGALGPEGVLDAARLITRSTF